ncbi:MAG: tRNA pseudouridine(38-40) synthase TruA [Gemmatimonadota bacterium]|nr:tRNA pseudouridine(38-40) synthase TruA [Gemmatimonadota bacterium]MDH3367020.1 tRNA pseudouridine(38-40) synthase TruA [Gemmatimonadota bacterium]MDH3478313.1 tRNA pseudouridine(38-40) synthase TruA [Gemmatimonadota bacterium]MDH3570077.1 tRNA pseudouridine(38-40) synthase TruA [Gemmatimonadota bacterium]MDH5550259.1 tRNA pseudouridine(38-40) synthase TruA [Gemmatimonadota bacterium]
MAGVPYYVILHYVGHGFAGWQRQPAERTVQAELEAALERLAATRVVAHAAGRTDAGVHALGQVASFAMPRDWEPGELVRALRALLPEDMWVAQVGRVPPEFHARRSATARRYRYVIGCDVAASSPFRRPFEWALGVPLDTERLRTAAAYVLGEHDFRGFSASGQVKPHYRCTVTVAEWTARANGEGCIFTVEADRFLHHMVRFLVGTMVDVGRDRRPVDDVPRLLGSTDNREASPPAPAHGLYLMHVRYPQLDEGQEP